MELWWFRLDHFSGELGITLVRKSSKACRVTSGVNGRLSIILKHCCIFLVRISRGLDIPYRGDILWTAPGKYGLEKYNSALKLVATRQIQQQLK